MRRLNGAVTVVEHDGRLLRYEDQAISDKIEALFKKEGALHELNGIVPLRRHTRSGCGAVLRQSQDGRLRYL